MKILDQLSETSLSAEATRDKSILLEISNANLIMVPKIVVLIRNGNFLMEMSAASTIREDVKQHDAPFQDILRDIE